MARTPSKMIPLGTVAPAFTLRDTISEGAISLEDLKSNQATVIMFICNHCPFVIHLHEGLQKFVADYQAQGVKFAAISSNDTEHYPQDGPDKMKQLFRTLGFNFPYLYDATQSVAKAYDAACTPDFYIFDKELKLVYRGQFDSSRPDNGLPVSGEDMRRALDHLLEGKIINPDQKPSLGCNIKWKEA